MYRLLGHNHLSRQHEHHQLSKIKILNIIISYCPVLENSLHNFSNQGIVNHRSTESM